MFIPVTVGLLDSTGKDIPLSSLYHNGILKSVASNEKPVDTTILRVTKVSSELLHLLFYNSLFYISMDQLVIL
jgi:aminopeptidase N